MLVGVNTCGMAPGFGGVEGLYLRSVLTYMRTLQPQTRFILYTDSQNHALFEGWDRICVAESARTGWDRWRSGEQSLARAVTESRADALFSSLSGAPAKAPVPLVLFAMDLRSLENTAAKGSWSASGRVKAATRLCKDASAVVAPSQYIRDRLLEVVDCALDKVVVAHLGVDEAFGEPQPCIMQQPYLLTVGDTHEHQNIDRLREALERLKEEIPRHSLVVVGRPGDAEPGSWGGSVVRVDSCAPPHLASLYQHCDLFIHPALYDGTGLAVLQGMRAGARVLTSRVGGVPEVAGEVPTYFNAESIASMIGVIRRGLEKDEPQLEQRIRQGQQVAKEYTWKKCAWKTLAAFKRA